MVQEVLVDGVDIVIFSGDKLFGGFQVGLIFGNCELIGWIKKNLFKCVLCVDKLIFVVFEVVFGLYCDLDCFVECLIILCLFSCLVVEICVQVECLVLVLGEVFGEGWEVVVVDVLGMIGSGVQLVVWLVSVVLCLCLWQFRCLCGCVLCNFEEVLCGLLLLVIGWFDDDVFWFDLCQFDDELVFFVQLL